MGKQRVTQLLAQLRENQAKEIENAAAIYTVAQVAVDALNQAQPADVAKLPATPLWDKASLLKQYGSHKGCRRAAKERGIKFRKTPSWDALEAAFNSYEVCQSLVQSYLNANPNPNLRGVSFEISLDDCQ